MRFLDSKYRTGCDCRSVGVHNLLSLKDHFCAYRATVASTAELFLHSMVDAAPTYAILKADVVCMHIRCELPLSGLQLGVAV